MILLRRSGALTLAVLLLAPPSALAQTQTVVLPQVKNAGGSTVPSQASVLTSPDGSAVDATHPLPTTQPPYAALTPMTLGTPYPAGRGWQAVCTAAGNAALVLAGGATDVVPLNPGLTILPLAVTQVASAGTTAACAYAILG